MPPAHRIHGGLFVLMLIMTCFGLVMLFSASMSGSYSDQGSAMSVIIKQTGITAVGLVAALFIATIIPIRIWNSLILTIGLYMITTGLLVYVKMAGIVINGARRWIRLPVAGSFQPSELAKFAMVFCFAGYVAAIRRRRSRGGFRFKTPVRQFLADGWIDILFPVFAIGIWIALVYWQPHVSGTLIMLFILLVILLAAGFKARSWASAISQMLVLLAIVAILFAAVLPLLNTTELQDKIDDNFEHVSKRLDTFFHPEDATSDDTYQIDQSIIAIGSGGLTGRGLGAGRQKYNYLPESYNDFIFAIIGEELGFVGTTSVVLLFLLFLLTGIGVALKASSAFAAILAGGYTMLITIQAILNMAVATKTIPATGISLPLFSYGGTANFIFLLAIGFVLAVSKSGQRKSSQTIRVDSEGGTSG